MRKAALLALLSTACFAHADLPESLTLSGHAMGYYGNNFLNPISNYTFPRNFDYVDNQFRLNNVTFDANYKLAAFDFYLSLWAGDDADTLADSDTAGSNFWRAVRRLGVKFTLNGPAPVAFEIGKMDTWIGLEAENSLTNWQFSRGVLYTLGQPSYHSGIKAIINSTKEFSVGLAAVTGWNESADGDPDPGFGVWMDYKRSETELYRLGFYFGDEGNLNTNDLGLFGGINNRAAGISRTRVYNLVGLKQLNEKLWAGFDLMAATSDDAPNDGDWSGLALYANQNLNDRQALGARLEFFDDHDGLRTGTAGKVNSFTLTYTHHITSALRGRLEFRRDWASQAYFESDTGFRKNQTTALLGFDIKF